MLQSKKNKLNFILNLYIGFGLLLWFAAAFLILLPIAPTIIYTIYPNALDNERESLTQNIKEDVEKGLLAVQPEAPQVDPLPPFDPSLPTTNMIIFPDYEVNAVIEEGTDYNAALDRGPWIVPDFGTPEENIFPMIIASHRWGALGWNGEERRERSFQRLPEMQSGDTIEIIWNQRKYLYEIYSGENSTQINDYEADLILYTCQFYWPSPERIFRYANRVN